MLRVSDLISACPEVAQLKMMPDIMKSAVHRQGSIADILKYLPNSELDIIVSNSQIRLLLSRAIVARAVKVFAVTKTHDRTFGVLEGFDPVSESGRLNFTQHSAV
ncbi:hypothetical protein [Actibacterium sp. XHP0104]|uniref:hypothetical protein n=1 Tax=Actibacterium sp. XHP0104 TaxID=2984335 RepID=UPI0021E842A3|nr:hypothetical protein [Actibacterium sp. XHP0104]MCV2883050.1 hypothetical protein [Actibacterium sp. XHP0104]